MRPWKNVLLAALFALAVFFFLFKTRAGGEYGDYLPVYGSVRCILDRCNPYTVSSVAAQMLSHGVNPALLNPGFWSNHSMLYPPLTYYLLAPLGFFDYGTSAAIWFWVSAGAFIASCLIFARLSPNSSRMFVVVALSVVLATSSDLLRLGQVSGITLAFIFTGSILFLTRKYRIAAALTLFIAAGLKPQLALPILTYFLIPRESRKYAAGALAFFVLASILAMALLTYQTGSAHWVKDLLAELHAATPVGPNAPIDTGIINLEGLTSLISGNAVLYRAVDGCIFAATLALIAVGWLRAKNEWTRDWVAVACISMLTLLLVYHRTYDMRIQVLTFPALGMLWEKSKKTAAVLTGVGCFLVFSTALVLSRWAVHHFGVHVAHEVLFRIGVERQQALFALLAAVGWATASACGQWRTSQRERPILQS